MFGRKPHSPVLSPELRQAFDGIHDHLDHIEREFRDLIAPQRRATRIAISFKPLGEPDNMATATGTIGADGTSITASLAFTDSKGNPATLPAPPVWSMSDAVTASMAVAADGLSAVFAPLGPVGTVTISVAAEGDPTPGVDPLTASGALTVTAAEARNATMSFGPAS